MSLGASPCTIRISKEELSALASECPPHDQGRYWWSRFQAAGLDPEKPYQLEYFPLRRCWVALQQRSEPFSGPCSIETRPQAQLRRFHEQLMAELRRTARAAFASLAASSTYFASTGAEYELPTQPVETTTAALAEWLRREGVELSPLVQFTSEGSWISVPRPAEH